MDVMKKRFMITFILLFCLMTFSASPAYANLGLLTRGIGRVFTSVFEIPRMMIHDSSRVIFPVGIVTGAVTGTVRTLVGALSGAADIARGAAPYAKYAVLFI